MHHQFQAAIFDLDGTLAYTVGDLVASMNKMLDRYGYPLKTKEELLLNVNYCERDWVKYSLPVSIQTDDNAVEKCRKTYVDIYNAHFLDTTVLYPGLKELLHSMKAAGIRLAVNTNKAQGHAQAIIDSIAPDIFELLMGDGLHPAKPNPTGALRIAEHYGLEPAEICYIGDSYIDMRTAVNAGMFGIGVTWGYCSAKQLTDNGAKALVANAHELSQWFAL